MITDFDILRDLIRDEALALVEDEYDKKTIILKEPGDQLQPEYTLKIRDVPDATIAFKVDLFPSPRDIFRNRNGECKRGDYVLIGCDNRANWIVYIEMKRGNTGSVRKIEQQLRGAKCLVAYCRAIGQEFWQQPKFLQEKNYVQRFVSVKNIGINKKETQERPQAGKHDAPDRMLKISAPAKSTVRFNKLVGSSQS